MPCHFLNVYPFVHLFRTGAILTVNDSVTLTVILLLLWLFQVSHPAVHLPRNSRESVPGVFPCRPPGTEIPQKRVRCLFPPSTWHGFSAKACQVSLPAVHLARFLCKSVSGSTSCCPPATESPRKRSRCPFPLPTWHGIPAKAFQVSHPAVHLPRFSCESVPGVSSRCPPATVFLRKCSRCPSLPSTCHGIPVKAFQVAFPASHLPRYSRKSVPGSLSRLPPATVSPRKRSRWHLPAVHLPRNPRESVPGVLLCRPPGTVSPRKRSR